MTGPLTFHAPADVAMARIRLHSASGDVTDWLTTPSDKTMVIDQPEPGPYIAQIEPPGQAPVAFRFEVAPAGSTEVTAPSFLTLANTAIEGAPSPSPPTPSNAQAPLTGAASPSAFEATRETSIAASESKAIAIGLSQDSSPGRIGGWVPFRGPAAPVVELVEGGLDLIFARPAGPLPPPDDGARLRLSVAIERTRVERLLLPLFQGGLRVALRGSSLTTADLSIRVSPIDLERRAMAQALAAGYADEAAAVARDLLSQGGVERFIVGPQDEDPWAGVLAALLSVRFPGVFGPKAPEWSGILSGRFAWIPDVHVLAARQALKDAGEAPDAASRRSCAERAVSCLSEARRRGALYFAYSNQLMGEMLGALASASVDDDLQAAAAAEAAAWRDNISLQRSAGIAFSWMMRAQRKADAKTSDAPAVAYALSRGNLDARYAKVLFLGRVDLSQISPRTPPPPASTAAWAGSGASRAGPKSAAKRSEAGPVAVSRRRAAERPAPVEGDPPALAKPIRRREDSNKGRFGGKAVKDGYRLDVAFKEVARHWVSLDLTVTADPAAHGPSYSDAVEFFLHETFEPSRLRARFRGQIAKLSIVTWGGFTVGAWIPRDGVELELDLSKVKGAPRIVREL